MENEVNVLAWWHDNGETEEAVVLNTNTIFSSDEVDVCYEGPDLDIDVTIDTASYDFMNDGVIDF